MSRLDDLPPDQRAALSLLLRQGKNYGDVAAMLQIGERAVHDRAHAALAMLAPREARQLSAEGRQEIGDYLLGQQSGAERLRTRSLLEDSNAAQAWAHAVASELQPLAAGALPEIPSAPATSAQNGGSAAPATEPVPAEPAAARAPVARGHAGDAGGASPAGGQQSATARAAAQLPSSRVGGAILLAVIAATVVAVVLLTSGGGSKHHASAKTSGATSASTSAGSGARASETNRIALTTGSASSKTVGIVWIFQERSTYAFYLAAEGLPPSHGFFYALWLYNSPTSFEALNRAPAVGSNGRTQGGQLLPANAGGFHEIILTRETSEHATHPGPIVLHGEFALHHS